MINLDDTKQLDGRMDDVCFCVSAPASFAIDTWMPRSEEDRSDEVLCVLPTEQQTNISKNNSRIPWSKAKTVVQYKLAIIYALHLREGKSRESDLLSHHNPRSVNRMTKLRNEAIRELVEEDLVERSRSWNNAGFLILLKNYARKEDAQ